MTTIYRLQLNTARIYEGPDMLEFSRVFFEVQTILNTLKKEFRLQHFDDEDGDGHVLRTNLFFVVLND